MARTSTLSSTVRTTLGFLTLAVGIGLSWPGVQVARADGAQPQADFERFMAYVGEETARAAAPSSDSCNAGRGLQNAEVHVNQVMAEMKRRAQEVAERAPQADGKPAVIMLNSRGYNYGAAPDAAAQIGQMHQEIARRRAPHS